ncbi:MAG TPA: MarR family winged helix-turn-helix transcriptional regulator [Pseudoflavonifractor sp.]|nr:MarR family winged helix-turn-helix transcriptional regulator [Pseudoflavonifractor sp.]
MEEHGAVLNRFLVDVFNEILKTEELCLTGACRDLSLRELHLIEEVCRAAAEERDNRSTAIAAAQRVTAGTLTTAVTLLEKKGYLERRRDEKDRRVVRILPTEKALQAEACHAEFHREMVEHVLSALSPEETEVFVRALGSVADFFRRKYGETV